jgi:hypothetical protein
MVRIFNVERFLSTPADRRTSALPDHDQDYAMADEIDQRNGWTDGETADPVKPETSKSADALEIFFRWLVEQPRLHPQQTALRALAAVHATRPDLLGGRTQAQIAGLMKVEERTFRRAAKSFRDLVERR